MRLFSFAIAACLLAALAVAQTQKLPADVDPQSYSRLPLLKRDQVPAEGQKVFDFIAGGKDKMTAPMGPQATSLYSLGVAEPIHALNQYLRNTVVGPAIFQVCTLIAAREYDENYEWAAHEAGAKRANVDQKTIDAIKFNRGLEGLPEKDALVVRFGRALFHDRNVPSELYAKVVDVFGKQGMYELTAIMGDYAMVAIMLRAVDQHVPNATDSLPGIKH